MNKEKAGSCKMEPLKWVTGCAGNACFECPIDTRRLCFPPQGRGNTSFTVKGNDGKPLVVNVTTSGTFVEAALKGCDSFANQKLGTCDYSKFITRGVIGATANTKFVCLGTASSTDCVGSLPKWPPSFRLMSQTVAATPFRAAALPVTLAVSGRRLAVP